MIPVRQLIVAVSPQLAAFSVGGSLAYPTQLLRHLKTNESTLHLDVSTTSWIGSIYGLSGLPVIFLPLFMQWRGRKPAFIITCLFLIIGWSLSCVANTTELYLTSEAFQGLATNSLMPISCLSMTEMLAPRYRVIFMQIFSISIGLGMAVVGILGRFIHIRTISMIMVWPAVIAVVISFFWPESPSWLACKGKFDKCEQAFTWLRGVDNDNECELKELVAAQKENLKNKTNKTMSIHGLWKQITGRDFYMPSLHMFILINMVYMSGGDVVLVYFLELVETTSQSQDAVFYAGIAFYLILLSGCIITNFTVSRFKNKTVLLSSTMGVIFSLICICVVTYLQSIGAVAKTSLLCMYCLISYMVFYSLGLNAIVFYIAAELMPVRHRSIGGALYIIINSGLYALTLKLSPYLIQCIGMSGTFFIFTINAIICALFVWKYVPETNGRTLQELEDFYMHGKFIKRRLDNDTVGLSNENI